VRAGVRRLDTPARYGGDEFVVLCPETDPTGAYVLAEKIRQEVAALDLDQPDVTISASLSIGVVAYPDDGRTADQLIISADQSMYASKRFGKNRVTAARSGPTRTTDLTAVPMGPPESADGDADEPSDRSATEASPDADDTSPGEPVGPGQGPGEGTARRRTASGGPRRRSV
jgi:hypothetical protein